jgi:hypothetical protein
MIGAQPVDSHSLALTVSGDQRSDPGSLSAARRLAVFLAPAVGTRNLALLALLRGKMAFRCPSLCRANIARGLRSHFAGQMTLDDQAP